MAGLHSETPFLFLPPPSMEDTGGGGQFGGRVGDFFLHFLQRNKKNLSLAGDTNFL